MSAIELHRLTKRYGDTVAVDDFSLRIEPGEFVALLGPSGCGKSTTLRMMAGLIEPTAGQMLVDGVDVTVAAARDRDLAMVFQSYALYPHLSVRANLAFGLDARQEPKSVITGRVGEVAEQLGLTQLLDRKPRQLSGGQRQRVALGRAIARRPRAFLMDEPLSNLDARLRTATRRELVTLHRSLEATIVYVTHDQVEAMTMATKIVVMNAGRIEQIGSPLDVYDRPASTFVAGFIGTPPMNLVDVGVRSIAGHIRLQAAGIDALIAAGETSPRDAVMGIRPGHIRVASDLAARPGDVPFAYGTVAAAENLGGEEVAFVELESTSQSVDAASTISVRSDRDGGPLVGDAVQLVVNPADIHLFDRDSGRRLGWHTVGVESDSSDTSAAAAISGDTGAFEMAGNSPQARTV